MATAPELIDDSRRRAREATGDLRERWEELEPVLRERWSEVEPVLRERWEDLEPILRERWEEVEPVVRERWKELEPVVRERLEDLEPAARQAQVGLWRALQVLFGALAALPSLLIRLARLLAGTADEVAERGAEVGAQVAKRQRAVKGVRLRKRTLVAYVGAGVAGGFVVGWLVGRRAGENQMLYGAPEPDAEEHRVDGATGRGPSAVE